MTAIYANGVLCCRIPCTQQVPELRHSVIPAFVHAFVPECCTARRSPSSSLADSMGNVLVLHSQMGNAMASGGSNALLPPVHVWDAEMQMLVLKVSPGWMFGFRLSHAWPAATVYQQEGAQRGCV